MTTQPETPAQLRAVTIYAPVDDVLDQADRDALRPGFEGELARFARYELTKLREAMNDKIRFHCKHAKETV